MKRRYGTVPDSVRSSDEVEDESSSSDSSEPLTEFELSEPRKNITIVAAKKYQATGIRDAI